MIDEGQMLAAVSLGALARRLGIRPQSLYAHVDGTEGLGRAVAVEGLRELTARVTEAGIGIGGSAAVAAIIEVHLRFARSRPGLYEAAIRPPGGDPELQTAIDAAAAPLDRILEGMGLMPEDRVHWTRIFLSLVYGYVVLHGSGRFALPVDTLDTEARLVETLLAQLHPVVV